MHPIRLPSLHMLHIGQLHFAFHTHLRQRMRVLTQYHLFAAGRTLRTVLVLATYVHVGFGIRIANILDLRIVRIAVV